MDKQEYQQLRKKLAEESKKLFEAEPEVDRWVNRKILIFRIMAIYIVLHELLTVIAYIQLGAGFNPLLEVIRPFFQVFWLLVFISPRGSWKINLALYFWAFVNLALNLNNYLQNIHGYIHIHEYLHGLPEYPTSAVVIAMELLIPFLFLGIACYLTLPEKHRRLSERADELQKLFLQKNNHLGK